MANYQKIIFTIELAKKFLFSFSNYIYLATKIFKVSLKQYQRPTNDPKAPTAQAIDKPITTFLNKINCFSFRESKCQDSFLQTLYFSIKFDFFCFKSGKIILANNHKFKIMLRLIIKHELLKIV